MSNIPSTEQANEMLGPVHGPSCSRNSNRHCVLRVLRCVAHSRPGAARAFQGDLLRAFLGACMAREARLARDTERFACARDAFALHMLRVRSGSGASQGTAAGREHALPAAAPGASRATGGSSGSKSLHETPSGRTGGSTTSSKPYTSKPQLRSAGCPDAGLGCAAALAAAFAGYCADPDQVGGGAVGEMECTLEARALQRDLRAVGRALVIQPDYPAGAGAPLSSASAHFWLCSLDSLSPSSALLFL